jgi:DNA-binding MarR family transcriptional regulator
VDRLEQAGFVGRRRDGDDRRIVRVRITAAGLELLSRLDRPILELHKRQLGHLRRAELTELNRLLVKARRPE